MTTGLFQRARSPERKQQRRDEILRATSAVLARDGFDATSLNAIAVEAGMVKSNIYRYFESREEILLRLMLLDFDDLLDSLERAVRKPVSVQEMADLFAQGFSQRPRLCHFISRLAMTLERNVTGEVLRDIKLALLASGGRAVGCLRTAFPEIPDDQCLHAAQLVFSLVAGQWPMSNPTGELQALLQEPQFADFNHDFETFLRDALVTVFSGLARNG